MKIQGNSAIIYFLGARDVRAIQAKKFTVTLSRRGEAIVRLPGEIRSGTPLRIVIEEYNRTYGYYFDDNYGEWYPLSGTLLQETRVIIRWLITADSFE